MESSAGYDVPPGCYVGVRVGDVLKQGRYEPQRCYHFPSMERRRNAKIDVYRHVGSCIIAVDPDATSSHEVNVASTDPTVPEMRLKVNVQSSTADAGKQREARTKAVKNQAKDYLTKFSIEEKLSDAVKALLKEQPADPTEFLCRFLQGGGSAATSPVAGGIKQATRPLDSSPSPTKEVDELRLQARSVLVKASRTGGLADTLKDVGKKEPSSGSKSEFKLRPSVGTWLAKPCGPKKVPVFSKLPSVGTWLARPTPMEPEPGGGGMIMPNHLLMGPEFYSLGLPNQMRLV